MEQTTCNEWLPQDSTVYYNKALEQNRSCDNNMMKNWNYSLNSTIINNWEERYLDSNILESQNVVGTYLASSCSEIVGTSYDEGNGYYTLDLTSKQPNVYCDMSDGGWAFYLISSNPSDNWNSINWDTTSYLSILNDTDLNNMCLTTTGMNAFADYTSTANTYWSKARVFLKNETNWFDFHQVAGSRGGISLGLKWTGSSWINMLGGATSLLPVDTTDSGDFCNGNLQTCGFWSGRDYKSGYGYGSGPEDWGFNETEAIMCGGKF